MEDSNKDQGHGKFPWICEFLLMLYPELQLYSKAIKWTENKSTGSLPTKERRKIPNRNGHFRTCNKKSTIPRTIWEMETNSISIEDDVTSGKELRNLWQGTTSNSRSFDEIKTILVGHYGTLWSLDGLWKLKIFLKALQTKQTTSSIVLKVTRLWFYSVTYPRQDKYKGRYSFKKRSD